MTDERLLQAALDLMTGDEHLRDVVKEIVDVTRRTANNLVDSEMFQGDEPLSGEMILAHPEMEYFVVYTNDMYAQYPVLRKALRRAVILMTLQIIQEWYATHEETPADTL